MAPLLPSWMGLWFSLFPTVETLAAQFLAGCLVCGSYFVARHRELHGPRADPRPGPLNSARLHRPEPHLR
jgi:hypothetical protein